MQIITDLNIIMTDKRIERTKEYIHSFLNDKIKVGVIPENVRKQLPIAINSTYDCYHTAIIGIEAYLCYPKDEKEITPSKVQNHLQMIKEHTGIPGIIVFEEIPSYNIKRLVDQRANFIIPGKQMFVPSLMMDLRKIPAKDKDVKEEIPAIAQCMILYTLQIGLDEYSVADISESYNVSYSTANRAVRWLQSKDFVFVSRTVGNVLFRFTGMQLWDKALPYLTSPIEKTIMIDRIPERYLVYSDTSKSGTKSVYIISKNESKNVHDTPDGRYSVEVWKYDPFILSKDKIHVDSISTYLAMKEKTDTDVTSLYKNLGSEFI